MSVGGVNPLEWVFPLVAVHHVAFDLAAKAAVGENAVNVPGSAGAKQKAVEQQQQQRLAESQELAAERARQEEASRPFTPQQEEESRRRLASASEFITGRKRQETLG